MTGYYNIKLLKAGLRVVCTIVHDGEIMRIIIISACTDGEVYNLAQKRIEKYNSLLQETHEKEYDCWLPV